MPNTNEPSQEPHSGWYFLIVATGLLAALSISIFVKGGIGDMERLKKKKQSLRKEYRQRKARLEKLRRREKRLHHDPYLIEKLAREKLGLDRPGEKVVGFRNSVYSDTSASRLKEREFNVPANKNQSESDTFVPSASIN